MKLAYHSLTGEKVAIKIMDKRSLGVSLVFERSQQPSRCSQLCYINFTDDSLYLLSIISSHLNETRYLIPMNLYEM